MLSLSTYHPAGTSILWLYAFRPRITRFSGSGMCRLRLLQYRLLINPCSVFIVLSEYLIKYPASFRYWPLLSSGLMLIQPFPHRSLMMCDILLIPLTTIWICAAPLSPFSAVHMYFSSSPSFRYRFRIFRRNVRMSRFSVSRSGRSSFR